MPQSFSKDFSSSVFSWENIEKDLADFSNSWIRYIFSSRISYFIISRSAFDALRNLSVSFFGVSKKLSKSKKSIRVTSSSSIEAEALFKTSSSIVSSAFLFFELTSTCFSTLTIGTSKMNSYFSSLNTIS